VYGVPAFDRAPLTSWKQVQKAALDIIYGLRLATGYKDALPRRDQDDYRHASQGRRLQYGLSGLLDRSQFLHCRAADERKKAFRNTPQD
jgi:hypothetical protein